MPFVSPDLPQTQAAIVAMTNAFRAENKLGGLAPNAALQAAAQAFAAYLARTGTFAHAADGQAPNERARVAGYKACMIAENIAMRRSTEGFSAADLARGTLEGWKTSPLHRANLLQPAVTETGIGIARSNDPVPKFLAVQLLGRPDGFKYSFSIENRAGEPVAYTLDTQPRRIASAAVITFTACAPRTLAFKTGALTAEFQTATGDRFVLSPGPDGAPRVERQNAGASVKAAKAVKPRP